MKTNASDEFSPVPLVALALPARLVLRTMLGCAAVMTIGAVISGCDSASSAVTQRQTGKSSQVPVLRPLTQTGQLAGPSARRHLARLTRRYYRDLQVGRNADACMLLAPGIRRQLTSSSGSAHEPCASVLARISAGAEAATTHELDLESIGAIRVDRRDAYVFIETGSLKHRRVVMTAVETEGKWRLSSIIGVPESVLLSPRP